MNEKIKDIMEHVDHTVLGVDATWDDVKGCVDDAIDFGCATAMIPPCYVKAAVEHAEGRVPVATVIGFPNGYSATAVKAYETTLAVMDGASEIDMVANVSWIKDGRWDDVETDIREVKAATGGLPLKVIVECCLLSPEEQEKMCQICSDAGAEYIKTSTGFSKGGATFEDVARLVDNAPDGLEVKAAGGISDFDDAERFIEIGADRLGTSRLVKIAKSM